MLNIETGYIQTDVGGVNTQYKSNKKQKMGTYAVIFMDGLMCKLTPWVTLFFGKMLSRPLARHKMQGNIESNTGGEYKIEKSPTHEGIRFPSFSYEACRVMRTIEILPKRFPYLVRFPVFDFISH